MVLTNVQQRIVNHIYCQGGLVRGLWPLTNHLNIDYASAYRRVQEMHAMGIIHVARDGRCLVISVSHNSPTFEPSGRIGVAFAQSFDSQSTNHKRCSP